MRFDIILGIARGLLYLHQDSRLRVSDFGIARIIAGKETEASTERVVGT
jgi:hypothetical protein